MENLSNSLTKFVSKIGEVRRRNSGAAEAAATRTAPRTRTAPCDSPSPKPPPRPGSPFLMLLMEGEEEEFQYNRKQEQNEATITGEQNECDNNLFRDSALGSSTSLDKIVGKQQSPDSSKRQEDIEHVHISPDQLDGTLEMSSPDDNYDSSDNDEAAMLENDTLRSHRSTPLSKEAFGAMFDHSGRLIQEHELRKIIFKGGVEESIRKDVWKFLFELYPFNSTVREREVLSVENTVRYEAMKIRWKKILKTLVNDYEGVRYCPKWYSGCPTSALERAKIQKIYLDSFEENIADEAAEVDNNHNNDDDIDSNHFNFPSSITSDDVNKEQINGTGHQICSNNTNTEGSGKTVNGTEGHAGMNHLHHRFKDPLDKTDGLECKQIDNISDALADAMLDCGHEESNFNSKNSTTKIPSSLDNSVLLVDGERCIDSSDYLCPELSPRLNEDIVHVASDSLPSEEDVEEVDEFSEKRFPNPFTLPPEYINTRESLYSQSENFESLDIYSLDVSKGMNRGESGQTLPTLSSEQPSLIYTSELYSNSNSTLNDSTLNASSVEKQTENHVCSSNIGGNITQKQNDLPFESSRADRQQSFSQTQCFQSTAGNNGSATVKSIGGVNEEEIPVNRSLYNCENATPNNSNQPVRISVTSDDEVNAAITHCGDVNAPRTGTICKDIGGQNPPGYNHVAESGPNNSLTEKDNSSGGSCNDANHVSKEEFEFRREQKVAPRIDLVDSPTKLNHLELESTTPTKCTSVQDKHVCTDAMKTPELTKLSLDSGIPVAAPAAESLERLSPWLAQMIKASTPTGRREKTRFEVEIEKYRQKEKEHEEILRKHNQEQFKRDQELLGIVNNANKFVEESIKNISGRISPRPASCDTSYEKTESPALSKTTINRVEADSNSQPAKQDSSFMSPISSSEVDIFISDTPSFKLVNENNVTPCDSVDFSPTKKDSSPCPYCSFKFDVSTKLVFVESLGEDQLKFMEIQAQVFAARQPYDDKTISESIRVIDKDVPRTDRELDMFNGDSNPGLLRLRDALLTYAFFHPEVGYAQGMNDIMSRFLFVMDSEVEAYWMFVNYMEHFKNDFMEAGMLRKIALVEQLLMKMDRELYDFLQSMDMGLIFCHRWLLLNFKREFEYAEAIRLFEITSSRHLEVSSLEAEIERSKERAKEFLRDSAGSHMEEVFLSPEYPFDIFVCVAMLMECRHMIIDTEDITAVYTILSHLPTTFDLQNILRRSEELFYRYCRKTTVDCFQIIDDLEVKDFKKKKIPFSFSFGHL